jgi:hypothetical protein
VKGDVGVPVAGGPSEAFTRERASATPARHPARRTTSPEQARASLGRPVRASLRSLQEWFAAAVMHPQSVEASVMERRALDDEPIAIADVARVVLPSSRLSSIERIGVYHDAYRVRLVECLADDYPALAHALGDAGFEELCLAYVFAHPSRSPNLNAFGRHMSAFCRSRGDARAHFSADLAALEWAMVEVIHTGDPERLSEDTLSRIPLADWTRARFARSDAVRVLEFEYPVNAYFQAFNTGEAPELPERAWSATAVFRDGATIWRMDLSRPMHALLGALFAGKTLGAALDALASSGSVGESDAPLLIKWFRDWVRYGFFSGIEVSPAS